MQLSRHLPDKRTFCQLLVELKKLKPGDLVGVNKDSGTLPAEYDARVTAMEVDERPTEQYSDPGTDRSCVANDTQRQIQESWHPVTKGCSSAVALVRACAKLVRDAFALAKKNYF